MAINTPFYILLQNGEDFDIYIYTELLEAKNALIAEQKWQIEEGEGEAVLYEINYNEINYTPIKTQIGFSIDGEIEWHD